MRATSTCQRFGQVITKKAFLNCVFLFPYLYDCLSLCLLSLFADFKQFNMIRRRDLIELLVNLVGKEKHEERVNYNTPILSSHVDYVLPLFRLTLCDLESYSFGRS